MLRLDMKDPAQRERGLVAAAAAVRRGGVVVLPLESGYGIAADAFSARGLQSLRELKARPDLTIPVLVPHIPTVAGIAMVPECARTLMADFWPGALTLILPAQPTLAWQVCMDRRVVAVRQPLHPVALELLRRTGPLGVVASGPDSGSGEPDAPAAGSVERVVVRLDVGALVAGPQSTVLDLTGARARLVRSGPVAESALLASCPALSLLGNH